MKFFYQANNKLWHQIVGVSRKQFEWLQIFSIPLSTIVLVFAHVMAILYNFVSNHNVISSLTLEERLTRGHWFQEKVRQTCALDGSLFRCNSAPSKQLRREMFSGKDKAEVFSLLGIVDGIGKFLWISESIPGSIPDRVSCQFESIRQWCTEHLSDSELLFADKAFYKLRDVFNNTIIPDRDNPTNAEISALRSIIERAWAAIKKWKSINTSQHRWAKNVSDYDVLDEMLLNHNKIITVIIGLYNIFHKPLSQPDQFPNKHCIQYRNPIDTSLYRLD